MGRVSLVTYVTRAFCADGAQPLGVAEVAQNVGLHQNTVHAGQPWFSTRNAGVPVSQSALTWV